MWLARVNKRATNKALIRLANRPPFAALNHVGRKSGAIYRVPLNAIPTEDGFVIALTYGPETDWVKNVQASSTAKLEYDGEVVELRDPEIVPRYAAIGYFGALQRFVLRLLSVKAFLRLYR